MTNLWLIFLTGLTVGGLSCLAVQGGLLASVIANGEKRLDDEGNEERKQNKFFGIYATVSFLIAKLIIHALFGALLGAFAGAITISAQFQTTMQLVAGIYMIIVALNLLEVHPILRYAVIQPPRFLARLVRNQSKSGNLFAPVLLGVLTIFIPCGTTLAIEALAISSAHALSGALIMTAFILGTAPFFLGIGALSSFVSEAMQSKLMKVAAFLVLFLGLLSVNGALVAFGSPISYQHLIQALRPQRPSTQASFDTTATVQKVTISITSGGYAPRYIQVRRGAPVQLTLQSKDAYSCASAFRIPSLNIAKTLGPNDTQLITFTPTKPGKIQFTCSMGMYTGTIEVL